MSEIGGRLLLSKLRFLDFYSTVYNNPNSEREDTSMTGIRGLSTSDDIETATASTEALQEVLEYIDREVRRVCRESEDEARALLETELVLIQERRSVICVCVDIFSRDELEELVWAIRWCKEQAIDLKDFERAANLRDQEKYTLDSIQRLS